MTWEGQTCIYHHCNKMSQLIAEDGEQCSNSWTHVTWSPQQLITNPVHCWGSRFSGIRIRIEMYQLGSFENDLEDASLESVFRW